MGRTLSRYATLFFLSSFLGVGAGRERGLQMDQGEGRGRRGSVIVPWPPNPSSRNPLDESCPLPPELSEKGGCLASFENGIVLLTLTDHPLFAASPPGRMYDLLLPQPHSNLDIEALIALATSHSPPSGYVNSNRSSTPNFVYGQSSPYSHSGTGTPVGGLGGIPDTRVALFVGNVSLRSIYAGKRSG